MQCSLLHLFIPSRYVPTGTEADWILLDSFKLHFQGFSRSVELPCLGPGCHDHVIPERALQKALASHDQQWARCVSFVG